jgi:hypothetical protein
MHFTREKEKHKVVATHSFDFFVGGVAAISRGDLVRFFAFRSDAILGMSFRHFQHGRSMGATWILKT